MPTVSAVVIAAPSSGSGKTTVATGLMGALRAAGHRVAPFKVGPDFIDPGYHSLASGRPGRNLDPVLVGEDLIGPLFAHGVAGADIAVIEGVMGLFDGWIDPAGMSSVTGSTAHVAGLLRAPVVLVVDARGQGHSIAALLHGFSTFDTGTRLAGVILNRVGSSRHEAVLRQACETVGLPVLGAIPHSADLAVPSRHLEAMTMLVAHHVDLGTLTAIAAHAGTAGPPWSPQEVIGDPVTGAPIVAVAAGRAFSFSHAEQAELLVAAGAQVVEFEPLAESLPAGTAAVVLPGGFPEERLMELSDNTVLRQQIHALAQRGPVYAECAGLTYLMSDLDGHPMCGVLDGSARFTPKLTLGYREAVAVADSPLFAAGTRVFGHEFHRTEVDFTADYPPAWAYRRPDGTTRRDGAVLSGVHASYLHTHPAAQPQALRRFVAHAAAGRAASSHQG